MEPHSTTPSFTGRLDMNGFLCGAEGESRRRSVRLFSSETLLPSRPTRVVKRKDKKPKAAASRPARTVKAGSPSDAAALAPPPRRGQGAGYAPPSAYAHLNLVPDTIESGLLVLFIGLNPGVETARSGHAYAHPSNLFWRLLHTSGITARRCHPREHGNMPSLFSFGLTNIVGRPSRTCAELTRAEMDAGVAVLEEKVRTWRPEAICIVGKSIWESFWRVRHGCAIRKAQFRYGWQDPCENFGAVAPMEDTGTRVRWAGAKVFVATTTSGLAASLSLAQKESIWAELGAWVKQRRTETLGSDTSPPAPVGEAATDSSSG